MDSIEDMKCPECGHTETFLIESGERGPDSLCSCGNQSGNEDCDFSGTVADFVVETATEPAKHRPCTNWAKPGESTGSKLDLARDLGRAYHAMYEGVRDMVDSPMPGLMGRLTRADIPDDYDWLINTLASIEALNSERATAC